MLKKKVGRPSNKYKRKVRNIKIIGIVSIISILGIIVFSLNNILRNNNLSASVNSDSQKYAMFSSGQSINSKMKELAGNEKNNVTKDAYNVFVISAFLLVKENLIKKDCNNDTLYFDLNNESYIPYMLELAGKIDRCNYIKNNTSICIQNGSLNNSNELENAIWVINKIRDSLAHGVYEIVDDKIIIDNDHTDEIVPYKLCCMLDIDDLAKFVLSVVTNTRIEKNDVFKYFSPILTKKSKNENYMMMFNGGSGKVLINSSKKQLRELMDRRRVLVFIEPNGDLYDIVIGNQKNLRKKITKDSHLQRSLMYGMEKASTLVSEALEEERLANKTIDVINSLTDYFGTSNVDDIIDYIYLYNYMELVFSLADDKKLDLPNLDLTNFDVYVDDVDYIALKDKISDIIVSYINKIEEKLETYDNLSDVVPFSIVENVCNSLDEKLEKKVISLNRIIISKLRNGVHHANIKEDNGLIKIIDKANQNSDDEKAYFIGTTHDFFGLISYIEEKVMEQNEEKFDNYLLNNVIDDNTYNDYLSILARVSNCKNRQIIRR